MSHIASDGIEAWTISKPKRSEVLELMVLVIEQWDVFSERNINYRSFLPLLRLLDVYHTPQCQHWAVWALANLTTVYRMYMFLSFLQNNKIFNYLKVILCLTAHKYCILVIREGGLEKLNTLISDPRPYERIKELAHFVIENCCHYSSNSNSNDTNELPLDGEYGLDG